MAKEIPGRGKVREIERRLASRLLEEVRQGEGTRKDQNNNVFGYRLLRLIAVLLHATEY